MQNDFKCTGDCVGTSGNLPLTVSEIQHALMATGDLEKPFTPDGERTIARHLCHFFYLGQNSARDMIEEMRSELAKMHAKIDMARIDIKQLSAENHALRLELEAMRRG